jgi:hypothetical protein
MYSDTEDQEEPSEVEGSESHDKELEELWSKKLRRRSSDLKIMHGDKLKLHDNAKMVILATRNG